MSADELTTEEACELLERARQYDPARAEMWLEMQAEHHGLTPGELREVAEGTGAAARARALRFANRDMQLPDPGLTAVRRLSTTPPTWEVEGALGTARLTTTQLTEFRYAHRAILDATGQVPELREAKSPKGGGLGRAIGWRGVERRLVAAAETVDVGELGTETGIVAEWWREYVRHAGELDDTTVSSRLPYTENGETVVYATAFLRHLRTTNGERLTAKELAVMMRAAGARHEKVNVQGDHGKTSTTVYRWAGPS